VSLIESNNFQDYLKTLSMAQQGFWPILGLLAISHESTINLFRTKCRRNCSRGAHFEKNVIRFSWVMDSPLLEGLWVYCKADRYFIYLNLSFTKFGIFGVELAFT